MNEDLQTVSWPGWTNVRVIGKGSYGKVYEIQRELNGETERAALKVITIPQSPEETKELLNSGHSLNSIEKYYTDYIQDIISEYQIMAKMKGHSNIVSCDDYRVIKHENTLKWDILIKMELLNPLVSYIQKYGMTENEIVKLAKDMCQALILCAQDGIIHRDIKPQNIFRSEHGNYKLGDFGIAKAADRTASGTIIGTYKYMAPEVYFGKPYGALADMYSLGLVLYWLLNNRIAPFLPSNQEIPSARQEEEARRKRFEGCPLPRPCNGSDALVSVVLKACAHEPEDRYSNASEMLHALERLDPDNTILKYQYEQGKTEDVLTSSDADSENDPYGKTETGTKKEKNRKGNIKIAALAACCLLVLILRPWSWGDKKEEVVDSEEPSETVPVEEEGISDGIYDEDAYKNSSLNLYIQKPDGYYQLDILDSDTLAEGDSNLSAAKDEIQDSTLLEFAFVNEQGESFLGYKERVMYREQSPTSYLQSIKQISVGTCSDISKTMLGNNTFFSMTVSDEEGKGTFYVIRKDDDLFVIVITGDSDETIETCKNHIREM